MHGLSHHLRLDAFARAMIAQLDIGGAVVAARIGLVLLVASLSLFAVAANASRCESAYRA